MAPKLEIILDRPGPFAPGDTLTGSVKINSNRSFDVQNIDAVLECNEIALEQIELQKNRYGFTAVGTVENIPGEYGVRPEFETIIHTVFNRTRHCVVRETLFPVTRLGTVTQSAPVQWSSQQAMPASSTLQKYERNYTLNSGDHDLVFEFIIPFNCPSTLQTRGRNSIEWTIMVKSYTKGIFSSNYETKQAIEVYQNPTIKFDPSDFIDVTSSTPVKVFFPGYKQSKRSFAGFVHNIIHTENEFKAIRTATLKMFVARRGIPQLTAPVGVRLEFDADHDVLNNTAIASYELSLLRKLAVDIYDVVHVSRNFEQTFSLQHEQNLNLPIEKGILAINETLSTLTIDSPLTETCQTESMNVSYVLKLKLKLASLERRSHFDKIVVSMPVVLLSCTSILELP